MATISGPRRSSERSAGALMAGSTAAQRDDASDQLDILEQRMLPSLPPDAAGLEALLASVRCTVFAAGWFPCAAEWRMPERAAPHYALWLCVGGRAAMRINGEAYLLEPGSVLFLPPHILRGGSHDAANPLQVYAVQLAARLYGVLDLPSVWSIPLLWRPATWCLEEIVPAVRRIVRELGTRQVGYTLAANGECTRLVALLWRDVATRTDDSLWYRLTRADLVLRLIPVFEFIQAHYREHLTLDDLAQVVHLHPAYFSVLFKQLTGLPPLHYIGRHRLQRAKELLLASDCSVGDIAASTGYRDQSYLSHVFRQAEGVTPLEYRKSKAATNLC